MLTEKVKSAVKSTPLLYRLLIPVAKLLRRQLRRHRAAAEEREKRRFRQYCLNLSRALPEPVFVKIGANDGITADPCSDILLAHTNWRGLLIEPVPYCFERLQENFRDSRRFRLEQVAIGTAAGEATFYYVDEKAVRDLTWLPPWFDQLGSFDRSHIVKHLDGALEPFIVECKVQVRPLSDVLLRNGIQEVHLLHVDTEGHDYEVLKTVDFAQHPPLSIFVEHKHLPEPQKSGMLHLLQRHGYSVRDCGPDYFAVHQAANRRLQRTTRHAAAASVRLRFGVRS
jgi:FkbM family methyltransferase